MSTEETVKKPAAKKKAAPKAKAAAETTVKAAKVTKPRAPKAAKPAEVGQHTTGAVFSQHFLRHFANHTQHFQQQWAIRLFKCNQRRDVTLRNDHNVHGPERSRVVIREHVIRFANDFHGCAPA